MCEPGNRIELSVSGGRGRGFEPGVSRYGGGVLGHHAHAKHGLFIARLLLLKGALDGGGHLVGRHLAAAEQRVAALEPVRGQRAVFQRDKGRHAVLDVPVIDQRMQDGQHAVLEPARHRTGGPDAPADLVGVTDRLLAALRQAQRLVVEPRLDPVPHLPVPAVAHHENAAVPADAQERRHAHVKGACVGLFEGLFRFGGNSRYVRLQAARSDFRFDRFVVAIVVDQNNSHAVCRDDNGGLGRDVTQKERKGRLIRAHGD